MCGIASRWAAAVAACSLLLTVLPARADGPPAAAGRQVRAVEGWTVQVSDRLLAENSAATEKALTLLGGQLRDVVRLVPAPAAAKLREVTIWFSWPYPGVQPTAEYHSSAQWLRNNGREPAMAGGVEITDINDFEQETRRMPNFVLHELAHAYHHRVVGNGPGKAAIIAAYKQARQSKVYDRVERHLGNGRPNRFEKAYAMENPYEYFAESSEAFFCGNDYFPFTRAELKQCDPGMEKLLAELWGAPPTGQPDERVDGQK